MRVLALAPSCSPGPSLSTTTSPSTLATTLAPAAPSRVASVSRAPGTGMPTASRCAAPILAACVQTPLAAHPLNGGRRRPGGWRSPSRVPGDDVVAGQQRDHAAEREKRSEREVQLAHARAVAGQQQDHRHDRADQADDDRDHDRAADVEPEHERELHVAYPHPAG